VVVWGKVRLTELKFKYHDYLCCVYWGIDMRNLTSVCGMTDGGARPV